MRHVLCTIVLFALAAPSVAAEDSVQAWVRKLGTPATVETVAAALDQADKTEDGPLLLAKALAAARGPAAVEGLRRLMRSPYADVRTAALKSMQQVGMRSEPLVKTVYASLRGTSRKSGERRQAVLALGTVGDGADMETLLALAGPNQKDARVRGHAFQAMAAISGKRMPFVHSRWSYWWGKQRTRGLESLRKALTAAEKASGTSSALAVQEAVITRLGWVDAKLTRNKLQSWLRGSRTDLQVVACKVAAALRLGDLAEDVARLSTGRGKAALRAAATRTLGRLGVAAGAPSR